MGPDERAVWEAMRSVYAAFLAGDSAAVDAVMAPGVTLWDAAEESLVTGLDELSALRARRRGPPPAPGPVDDASAEVVRNTSVWRCEDGRWLAVHNHEDVVGGM